MSPPNMFPPKVADVRYSIHAILTGIVPAQVFQKRVPGVNICNELSCLLHTQRSMWKLFAHNDTTNTTPIPRYGGYVVFGPFFEVAPDHSRK